MNIIRVSGDNLVQIISDILDLSKIETHKLVLERAQFGVREMLTESLSLLQVIAQEKGIKVLDRPHHRDVDVNYLQRNLLLALTAHFLNVPRSHWFAVGLLLQIQLRNAPLNVESTSSLFSCSCCWKWTLVCLVGWWEMRCACAKCSQTCAEIASNSLRG